MSVFTVRSILKSTHIPSRNVKKISASISGSYGRVAPGASDANSLSGWKEAYCLLVFGVREL